MVDHLQHMCLDDDRYLDSAVSNELGDIKLEITYVKKGEKERLKVAPFITESKVHERTQKLAQHHTRCVPSFSAIALCCIGDILFTGNSLGQTVRGERKITHSIKPIGNTRVFLFKYRPLGKCWFCIIGFISKTEGQA